ncbi:MAG: thioredoxin domain-containing protein [Breznakia sp.]
MKKILVLGLCCFLFACSGQKEEAKITLDANAGEVVALRMDGLIKKIENKETFVFLFSQTYCGSCMRFFAQSDAYTKEVGLTLYDISLDKEDTSKAQQQEIFDQYFSGFQATPTLYFIKAGKVVDELNASQEEVTLDAYQAFLKRNQIVKK